MPIRMVDDPNQDPEQDNSGNRERPKVPGGGGINPLIFFLPKVIGFLFKRPKIGIPLLIIGAIIFFFSKGCNISGLLSSESNASFSKGCDMKQEVYDKAEVFEGLYANNSANPMPDMVSLLQYCPTRGNQGQQGSCVAWSSAYAARTILQSQATGQNPNSVVFSPSYLYNQIKLDGCQGSYINLAMETMQKTGGLPMSEFPYNEQSCSKAPSPYEIKKAQQFNIRGAQRLTLDGEDYRVNMPAIKQNLSQGGPVVIGMKVGGSFMQDMVGKEVWYPTNDDYDMNGFGGHAMCVIGYDDNKAGGSFQIMNSWGEEWGTSGYCYVRYKDFDHFVVEAYGLYPMGNAKKNNPNEFAVNIGLAEMNDDNTIKGNIGLRSKGANLFETTIPLMKSKTRFKLLVNNSIECYTYIFGQELNGTTYTLFPYTEKHSPFCGITGTRLFPSKQSLQPDNEGSRDVFAIIVTKKAINYAEINKQLSQSTGTLQQRVQSVFKNDLISNINYTAGTTIGFKTAINNPNNVVSFIIEVPKN